MDASYSRLPHTCERDAGFARAARTGLHASNGTGIPSVPWSPLVGLMSQAQRNRQS